MSWEDLRMNYIPRWRTSWFKVKDLKAFRQWIELLDGDYRVEEDGEKILVYSTGEQGTPQRRYLTEDEAYAAAENEPLQGKDAVTDFVRELMDVEPSEIDYCVELAAHLTDDCVVCCTEIGYEGHRYVVALAVLLDSSGQMTIMNLREWAHDQAAHMWPSKEYDERWG